MSKLFASDVAMKVTTDAVQIFGGYGYMREYEVERIKRDVKILPLYEGTSEIQQNIISIFRLRETVRSKGTYYAEMADGLEKLPEEVGAHQLAQAMRAMNEGILGTRKAKLTRQQYVLFLLADMMTWCEVGAAVCRKAAVYEGKTPSPEYLKAVSRLFAREANEKVLINGLKIARGCDQEMEVAAEKLESLDFGKSLNTNLSDMNLVAAELVK